MKKETKRKAWMILRGFLFGAIYIILMLTSSFIQVSYHEEVHHQIYLSYGIDSEVYYDLEGGTTRVTNMTQYNKYCTEKCKEMQDWAELIGYNVVGLGYVAWFLLTAIIIFVIFRRNEKK